MEKYAVLLLNIFIRATASLALLIILYKSSEFMFKIDFTEEIKKENRAAAVALAGLMIFIGLIGAFTTV